MFSNKLVVIVHGWKRHPNRDLYELSRRLAARAKREGFSLTVQEVSLGDYVQVDDGTRMNDLALAFQACYRKEIAPRLRGERRFACIANSIVGTAVRTWWSRLGLFRRIPKRCPVSHLILLAPPNFGISKDQVPYTRFRDAEPGEELVRWLEPGNPEAWKLNEQWIRRRNEGVFTFVFAVEQDSGWGEGVRLAAANLNATCTRLATGPSRRTKLDGAGKDRSRLTIVGITRGPRAAFLALPGPASKSGSHGALEWLLEGAAGEASDDPLGELVHCLRVRSASQYDKLCEEFDRRTTRMQEAALEAMEPNPQAIALDASCVRRVLMFIRLRDQFDRPVTGCKVSLTGLRTVSGELLPGVYWGANESGQHAGVFELELGWSALVALRAGGMARPGEPGLTLVVTQRAPESRRRLAEYELGLRGMAGHVHPNESVLIEATLEQDSIAFLPQPDAGEARSEGQAESIKVLRRAFQRRNLTLFLGAGVSVGSGLPDWDQLVTSLYTQALQRAVVEWPLISEIDPAQLGELARRFVDRSDVSLEVMARKLLSFYREKRAEEAFLGKLHELLYVELERALHLNEVPPRETGEFLCRNNKTLAGVAQLCRERSGVRQVITYNYDDLLETALAETRYCAVYGPGKIDKHCRPIYHVHGFLPRRGRGSKLSEVVLTEDQYHQAARDTFSWTNLVQMNAMMGSVGLMIGLSLADPNMRRLLDAVRNVPRGGEKYALLHRPTPNLKTAELEDIAAREVAGDGKRPISLKRGRLKRLLDGIRNIDQDRQSRMLQEFGVKPIWYDDHQRIPDLLERIWSH